MPAGKLERQKYARFKEGKVIIYISKEEILEEDYVEGYITNIFFKKANDPKFSDEMHLVLYDTIDTFDLQMSIGSKAGKAFLQSCANINAQEMVQFIPTFKIVDGQKKNGVIIKQRGQLIKWAWTNDNPGPMPPKVPYQTFDQVSGKMVEKFQDVDRMAFLRKYVLNDFMVKLPAKHTLEMRNNIQNIKKASDIGKFDDEEEEDINESAASMNFQAPFSTPPEISGTSDTDLPF